VNIIAIDSSDQILSVALSTSEGAWYIEIDAGQRHSELLMESVDNLCKSAGLQPGDLNQVYCMKGPGSFTGLRIAFAAAKGLSLALGIPLSAVPTLDCMAYPLSIWPGIVLPAIDAKKSSFFAALYRGGERLSDFLDAQAETLAGEFAKNRLSPEEKVVLTGPGANLLYPRLLSYIPKEQIALDPQFRKGRARELLEIAKSGIFDYTVENNSGPVYLRKSDAELKLGDKQED